MNTGRNHPHNTSQARCTMVFTSRTSSKDTLRELKEVFANYSIDRLNAIDKMNLKNYYIHYGKEKITRCLLCDISFKDKDTFEHTTDLQHKYNKRFYTFVQNRSQQGDLNFIFLNANWVQCRYCNNGRISNRRFQRISHIQSSMHTERKRYYLNRITDERRRTLAIQQAVTKAPEPCKNTVSQIVRENQGENSLRSNNERHFVAVRSTEVHVIRQKQSVTKVQEPCKNTVSQIVRQNRGDNSLRTNNERQFVAGRSTEVNVIRQKQSVTKAQEPCKNTVSQIVRENSLRTNNERQFVAGRSTEVHVIRQKQSFTKAREPCKKTFSQIVRENQGENSLRTNNERQFVAGRSTEVNVIRQNVTLPQPARRPQNYRYPTYDSDDEYHHNAPIEHTPIDSHTYYRHHSYTPSEAVKKDNIIPTWGWIGVCAIIAYWSFRRSP